MERKEVQYVITDLDDTIWNWFEMWYVSFSKLCENIVSISGKSESIVKEQFKALHQKYGSTEFSFAIRELGILSKKQIREAEIDKPGSISAMHQYYRDRKNTLAMYESVHDTLVYIKSRGTKIIGFTESNSFFTKTRLKNLGLDGLFDCIYCPSDKGIPKSVKRYYPKGYWELSSTKVKEYPAWIKKPNPEILLRIISDYSINPAYAIYIGDKIHKDITMANIIGMTSCYAKYGDKTDDKRYDLLREVTHWTSKEVNQEIAVANETQNIDSTPTITLTYFKEIIHYCEFISSSHYSNDDIKNLIDMWKETVEVQKHFNDIELRIRSLAITIFTFLIGGIGYTIKESIKMSLFGNEINTSVVLSLIAIIILSAFYLMDRHWYHNFLHS